MTPGRHHGRMRPASPPGGAGLVIWIGAWAGGLATLLLVVLVACDPGGRQESTSSASAARAPELGLAEDAELHRVTLGGRGAEEHAVPSRLDVRPGDAVEFHTVDHRVHTVEFPVDSLSAEHRAFLEESRQRASPPLVRRGTRFLVLWEGAPPGRYPFVSRGHGGAAWGVIRVLDPAGEPDNPPGSPG